LNALLSGYIYSGFAIARPGSFRLVPPENQRSALERGYRAMRDMFYREQPEFDEVLRGLQALEGEINSIH
jgi:hypothetical protein